MTGETVAGFDLGGSKTEAILLTEKCEGPLRFNTASRGVPCLDPESPLPFFEEFLDALPAVPSHAVINLTGRNKTPLADALSSRGTVDAVAFREAEGTVPLFAAAEMGCGSVLMGGTGAVYISSNDDSLSVTDGWGWRFGDAGSGYWIGSLALRWALRRLDQGLSPILNLPWPAPPREDVAGWTAFRDRMVDWSCALSNREVAALTAEVGALALQGDEWALEVLRAGADELLRTILSGGADDRRPVLFMGGLSRCRPLAALLREGCRARGLELVCRPALGLSLAAAVMAARRAGWDLELRSLLDKLEREEEYGRE